MEDTPRVTSKTIDQKMGLENGYDPLTKLYEIVQKMATDSELSPSAEVKEEIQKMTGEKPITGVAKDPLPLDAKTNNPVTNINECVITWYPSELRVGIVSISFVIALIAAFISSRHRALVVKHPELLMIMPVIISFTGTMAVQVLTKTILIYDKECFKDIWAKMMWIFKQMIQGALMGLIAGLIGSAVLKSIHFHNITMYILITVLPMIALTSCMLGVVYPVLIKAFLSASMLPYSGTAMLLTNDILCTYMFFVVAHFIIRT
jgi:hypothetical protein